MLSQEDINLRTPSSVDRFPLNSLVHEMAVWCILTLGEIFLEDSQSFKTQKRNTLNY